MRLHPSLLLSSVLPIVALAEEPPAPEITTAAILASKLPVSSVKWRDPVYGGAHRYTGYWLSDVITLIPGYGNFKLDENYLIFRSQDGYDPLLEMEKLSIRKGFLASSNRPSGRGWAPFGPNQVSPEPAYLLWERFRVWERFRDGETEFPWPYQVTKIELISKASVLKAIKPPAVRNVESGFELFKEYCLRCHGSGRIGGTRGPQLKILSGDSMKWNRDSLFTFIQHSGRVRPGITMPDFGFFPEGSVSSIIEYLKAMNSREE
jgi:cytochrome c2